MKLFVDRCHRKNYWYIVKDGSFVAGPFDKKGAALSWLKEHS